MKATARQPDGFTLIEIMIVVGIIGLLAAFTVPAAFRAIQKEPLRRAVDDIVEACSQARAEAVLKGHTMAVVFTAEDASISVAPAGSGVEGGSLNPSFGGFDEPASVPVRGGGKRRGSKFGPFSARLSEDVGVALLDVNLTDFMEAEQARVRFYPNGTSDEFTIVLQSVKGGVRMISLEVTTGLPQVKIVK